MCRYIYVHKQSITSTHIVHRQVVKESCMPPVSTIKILSALTALFCAASLPSNPTTISNSKHPWKDILDSRECILSSPKRYSIKIEPLLGSNLGATQTQRRCQWMLMVSDCLVQRHGHRCNDGNASTTCLLVLQVFDIRVLGNVLVVLMQSIMKFRSRNIGPPARTVMSVNITECWLLCPH